MVSESSTVNTPPVINLVSESISAEVPTAPITPTTRPSFPWIGSESFSIPKTPASRPIPVSVSPSPTVNLISDTSESMLRRTDRPGTESGLHQNNPGSIDPSVIRPWDAKMAEA